MNPTQLPFLVEGVLIAVTMLFGILLDRAGKPYGRWKLVIHILLFLWFSVGFGFIVSAIWAGHPAIVISLLVTLMGVTILIQLVTGVWMLFAKQVGKPLTTIHLTSAIVLILADIVAFFAAGGPA